MKFEISKLHAFIFSLFFFTSSVLIDHEAYAATAADYQAICRYTNKLKKVKYTGPCSANFGLSGMNSEYGARYIVTFPNKTEIIILIYENDLSIINGIPAKRLPSPPKTIRFLTGQNEEFQFTTPPSDSL